MSRKKMAHQPGDRPHIDIYEDKDVAYWTRMLGVTRAELTDAISKVGANPEAVTAKLSQVHL